MPDRAVITDDAKPVEGIRKLETARLLMIGALALLDETSIYTDADPHLDLAIHYLDEALANAPM